MREDIDKVLLTESQIAQRVAELARQISSDYAGQKLVLLAALKGAVVFLADLMRLMEMPVCVDFIVASSYGDRSESSGDVRINYDICDDLCGSHVLVIEDIVDTGRTLSALVGELRESGALSVRTCCLLDKPSRRIVDFAPDYLGFEIPDHFVVGYGLDYAQKYRNLPFVGVLKPEVYQS